MKGWVLLSLGVAGLWWYGTTRMSAPASPPGSRVVNPPLQLPASGEPHAISLRGWTLKPLARFTVEARILSKTRYASDATASLAPYDFALGWGPMSDTAVLERLHISQHNRAYHWRYWGEPPIPERDITRHSANLHLVPADDTVASRLDGFKENTFIRLTGHLVEATHPRASHPWRSSLTREDSGDGSCEILHVTAAAEITSPR